MKYEAKEFTLKNGLKITVKSPDKADAAELLAFIIRLCGRSPYLLSTAEDYAGMTVEKEEAFIEAKQAGGGVLMAVYVDGKIVGDCDIRVNRHIKDRHRCEVGIGIDEAYCSMGIGSVLFDEMIRIATEMEGVEQMELGVNRENIRARNLYQKKGFTETGYISRALKQPDGRYQDEILMVKYLNK